LSLSYRACHVKDNWKKTYSVLMLFLSLTNLD